ncbi:MAG: hypothetical protein AAF974_07110 [Cyanobacteria bacterium P01_E01_bin.34]
MRILVALRNSEGLARSIQAISDAIARTSDRFKQSHRNYRVTDGSPRTSQLF